MIRNKVLAIFAFFITLSAFPVFAQGDGSSFGYDVISDSADSIQVRITGNIPIDGAWLGVTVYPPNVKDASKEGVSQIYPLKKGQNVKDIAVNPRFRNGTIEAAVWGKKIMKKDCPATDTACQSLGYKLTGMQAYVWGYITHSNR